MTSLKSYLPPQRNTSTSRELRKFRHQLRVQDQFLQSSEGFAGEVGTDATCGEIPFEEHIPTSILEEWTDTAESQNRVTCGGALACVRRPVRVESQFSNVGFVAGADVEVLL